MPEIISIQECEKIILKALNINENADENTVQVIKYELSTDEDSFGYIGDFSRLTVWIEKVI